MSIKRAFFAFAFSFFLVFAMACGSEEESTETTCDSSHECINDVCECTTEGKDGEACTDNDTCPEECEVCTEM